VNKQTFDGRVFNDDRMFVLYLCRGEVNEVGKMINVSIHHEEVKVHYHWCMVTYWNTPAYEANRIDVFPSESVAIDWLKDAEPRTPLISLGGIAPSNVLSYDEYEQWKKDLGYKDYEYGQLYSSSIMPGTEAERFAEEIGRNEFIRLYDYAEQ
jgi:hypothetical protein